MYRNLNVWIKMLLVVKICYVNKMTACLSMWLFCMLGLKLLFNIASPYSYRTYGCLRNVRNVLVIKIVLQMEENKCHIIIIILMIESLIIVVLFFWLLCDDAIYLFLI